MFKTAINTMNRLNLILDKHNLKSKIIWYSKDIMRFNNNKEFTGNEKCKLYQTISKELLFWLVHLDDIIFNDVLLSDIKKPIWNKGLTMKNPPWNKGLTMKNPPWNKGMVGVIKYGPIPQDRKDKISKANSGKNNGMYGHKHSDDYKLNASNTMKAKILSGEFTPNTNNRNTHWESTLDNIKYKSSWEVLYKYHNPNAEYEKLRIEYNDNGNNRIYIVDFIDHSNKIIAEIKPESLCSGDNFNNKQIALQKYAKEIGYSVLIVTEHILINYNRVDNADDRFDSFTYEKILKFYETY
jgi:hypothetical protein